MNICLKCRRESVRKGEYTIGSKDLFSFVTFEGIAEIGFCANYVTIYARKRLTKQLLIGIGTLIFLIIALTEGLSDNIMAFAMMITFLGSGFISIISYLILKMKLSTPNKYAKEIDEAEYQKIIEKKIESDTGDKRKDNSQLKRIERDFGRSRFYQPHFQRANKSIFKIGTT